MKKANKKHGFKIARIPSWVNDNEAQLGEISTLGSHSLNYLTHLRRRLRLK